MGCRPKALSDNYNVTRFKETLCLVKLLDPSSPLPASATGAADGDDDARRSSRARAVMRHRHRGMMAEQAAGAAAAAAQKAGASADQQQQQQRPSGGGWWAGVRQALRGAPAPIGSIVLGGAAPGQAATAQQAAAPQAADGGGGQGASSPSRAMQQQDGRAEAGRGEGLPSQEHPSASDVDPHVPPVPNVTITSHDWPLGQLTPLHYHNQHPPVEKNWVSRADVPLAFRNAACLSHRAHLARRACG